VCWRYLVAATGSAHVDEQKLRPPFWRPRPSTFAPHAQHAGAAWTTAQPKEQKTDSRPRYLSPTG
jgi:hypothetical protein